MVEPVRTGTKWMLAIVLHGAFSGIGGCAGVNKGLAADSNSVSTPAPASYSPIVPRSRNFTAPTAMDSLLSAHPHALPAVIRSVPPDTVAVPVPPNPLDKNAPVGTFQIQVDALASMDAAQERKAILESKLGVKMEMIFDPPYYKLRFGKFTTRGEAEDKLLELAQKKVQGFILRQ